MWIHQFPNSNQAWCRWCLDLFDMLECGGLGTFKSGTVKFLANGHCRQMLWNFVPTVIRSKEARCGFTITQPFGIYKPVKYCKLTKRTGHQSKGYLLYHSFRVLLLVIKSDGSYTKNTASVMSSTLCTLPFTPELSQSVWNCTITKSDVDWTDRVTDITSGPRWSSGACQHPLYQLLADIRCPPA